MEDIQISYKELKDMLWPLKDALQVVVDKKIDIPDEVLNELKKSLAAGRNILNRFLEHNGDKYYGKQASS